MKNFFFETKNNAKENHIGYKIDNEFCVSPIQNNVDDLLSKNISTNYIQFYYCLEGEGEFSYNEGNYTLKLNEKSSFLFYNPNEHLPLQLKLKKNSKILMIILSIKKLHSLFSYDSSVLPFLNDDNIDKKYYNQSNISPKMEVCLNQIFGFNLSSSTKHIFYKGKVYELLSLYFGENSNDNIENCPYLKDEENVLKIKQAKDFLIKNISKPPTIKELSEKVKLPEHKLKEGFKNLYGDTIYSYLMEHKMKIAIQLLEEGKAQIKEIGFLIGYENPSHFIAAFKKKFGVTPKQYNKN